MNKLTVRDPITSTDIIIDTDKLSDSLFKLVIQLGLTAMLSNPDLKKTLLAQINDIAL